MDFNLTEEQEMLKTMARDFLEKECPVSLVRDMEEDEAGYSPEDGRGRLVRTGLSGGIWRKQW